ncbi:MAG TPA: alpha-L-fucosidase [Anaerohalosphaeraceae bacterium]|nr:alpha-L-fucosidase [Anaerohalosphaeraceae bacterium]
MMKTELPIACVICLAACLAPAAVNYTPEDAWKDAQIELRSEKSTTAQRRMDWWRDARFGMFIHWNPSSVAVSEISWSKQFYDDTGELMLDNPRPDDGVSGLKEHTNWISWFKPPVPNEVYDNLYKSFYPGMFDADQIAAQARSSGMKYIVMVAKHHDGFCMWNSQYTDFDMESTPFKRDLVGEMAKAARKAGLKFGIYYSQRDWHHPDYRVKPLTKYNEYMRNQIKELLTEYGDISLIFFDAGAWKDWKTWESDELFKIIYKLQPNIVINNRCGVPGDYSTPEQKIGIFNTQRDWESCMTFTGFWSWHGFQTPVKPYEECLKYLVSCAGGDGNLLMNVGPLPTGQIDPRENDRMQRIGKWLEKNGQAIYGTRGGPYKPTKWGVSTHKDIYVYLLVWDLQAMKSPLPAIDKTITAAEILGGDAVAFEQSEQGISLSVDPAQAAPDVTVIRMTLEGSADSIEPISMD